MLQQLNRYFASLNVLLLRNFSWFSIVFRRVAAAGSIAPPAAHCSRSSQLYYCRGRLKLLPMLCHSLLHSPNAAFVVKKVYIVYTRWAFIVLCVPAHQPLRAYWNIIRLAGLVAHMCILSASLPKMQRQLRYAFSNKRLRFAPLLFFLSISLWHWHTNLKV